MLWIRKSYNSQFIIFSAEIVDAPGCVWHNRVHLTNLAKNMLEDHQFELMSHGTTHEDHHSHPLIVV